MTMVSVAVAVRARAWGGGGAHRPCALRALAARGGGTWWRRGDAEDDDDDVARRHHQNHHRHQNHRRRASSSSSSSSVGGGDGVVVVGALHVITGPMFAGKTSALLRAVEDERARGRRVFVAKSARDTRFGDVRATTLTTHDGKRCAGAFAVGDLLSLSAEAMEALEASDVVAIDEAQFLANLTPFARRCVERDGKTVYVAGLDGDFKREKFGDVLDLVPMCDTVTRLRGRCSMCGADSLFSLRTTSATSATTTHGGGGAGDDVDADTNDPDAKIVVGGADKYAPACRQCYVAHVVAR
jgi:thymidine kinase